MCFEKSLENLFLSGRKFKVCKTGGWKKTSQQPIYTVYTQHKRLRIEPISILQSAQWALLFPYNLALFALSFFVVSPSHHLFFSFAHKRLQLADSRPSVREDRSVMFLSAERRMNELPTVSEPLKPHQSLLLLLLATTLPSHLPSFPFSMPSASPFICLVLSPSHSDFVPSSVWAVVVSHLTFWSCETFPCGSSSKSCCCSTIWSLPDVPTHSG